MVKYKWIGLLLLIAITNIGALAQIPPPLISMSNDSLKTSKDSIPILPYSFDHTKDGKLFLSLPSTKEIVYDAELKQYMIIEKIGNYEIKYPVYMSSETYNEYVQKKEMLYCSPRLNRFLIGQFRECIIPVQP